MTQADNSRRIQCLCPVLVWALASTVAELSAGQPYCGSLRRNCALQFNLSSRGDAGPGSVHQFRRTFGRHRNVLFVIVVVCRCN